MTLYKIITIAFAITLFGCDSKKQSTAEHTEIESVAEHSEANIVFLTDEQLKAANVVIGNIEMKNLTTAIRVNGTLAVPNQNKALITSVAGGVLLSLRIQPGDFVKKGQVVGTIANTELSNIQQQLITVNSQIRFAEQEQKRQQELVEGNAAPLKNLQKAQAELNGLKAQRSALQQHLSILGISSGSSISSTLPIKAPISGTISEISAKIGSNIDANAPIAQITNNSQLHLDLFVYEKDLPKVAPGQTIHFTLTNNPGKEYDAKIYSIGTAFINETKAVPVHAQVINEKTGLIEGMSVTATVSLTHEVYPAVPDEAIVSNEGKEYIFIVTDNPKKATANSGVNFQRIQIVKGASDVGYTQIEPVTVLPNDTKVAVKGAFFLMAKMTNVGEE